ncbi:MAG: hypothetical protein QME88_11505 [Actinomycetota bacterium]|nr:hypothetical protein [Actinomycetota bacterium]
MEAAGANAVSSVRSALSMILNPAQALRGAMERVPWPFCLSVSGLAFTLFFLQTGLDMKAAGTASAGKVAGFTFLGLALGTAGVALVAALAWACSRPLGGGRPLSWTVRAFCLAYTPTLIFCLVGMFVNLVSGWYTAVAFGVTGALWALYPMISIVKEMTGEKILASLLITTVCGGLVLSGWALLGI